ARHRLRRTGRVDHGEPHVPEPHARPDAEPLAVGAAVAHLGGHRAEQFLLDGSAVETKDAYDAAHRGSRRTRAHISNGCNASCTSCTYRLTVPGVSSLRGGGLRI